MNNIFLKDEYYKILQNIFSAYCPNAEILAYGSRINNNAHDGSDLDLVVKSFNDNSKSIIELREILNQSNIPFLIDINEYGYLPKSFQEEIDRHHIVIFNKQGS